MKVVVGSETFYVSFKHQYFDPTQIVAGTAGRPRMVTDRVHCTIAHKTGEDDKIVATTDAYCSIADEFDLHSGRRVALSRALYEMGASPDQRVIFWEAFVKTLPKPKRTVKQLKKRVHELTTEIERLNKLLHDPIAELEDAKAVRGGD